ncbi:glutamate receptor ionotropic, delta-2-like isoform X2 [Halyomorpha halys]|uniref:glutamate receptor ionotropic, delta-2-like isoform X2 n=1 Tax=Halyomorpha halys TaxID=286706 RepID=UPI0034D20448|nr:Ionotropic receptor 75h [Halyomorpha halys]
MRLQVLLIFALFSTCTCKNMTDYFEIINIYFNYRNVKSIDIFPCTESEGYWMFKRLLKDGYSTRVNRNLLDKEFLELPYIKGWFVDLTCSKNIIFFSNITGLDGIWLGYPSVASDLNMTSLRLDSDVMVGSADGRLWDLYGKPLERMILNGAGTWRPANISIPKIKFRYDLGGVVLKGVLVELDLQFFANNITHKIADHDYFPDMEMTQRVSYIFVTYLAKFYNFWFDIVPTDTWGANLKNGSCTGMIGILQRKEADIGISACSFRVERVEVVSFAQRSQELRFICMFMEERIHGTYSSLLIPFSFQAWLCVFVAIVVGATIFSFLQKRDLTEGIIFVTAILSQQGLQKDYRSISARVYSISLLILGLVLYSYYSAAIMNGLLSPAPGSIRNVDDVVKSPMKASLARVPYMIPKVNQKAYVTPELLAKTKRQEKSQQILDVFVGVDRIRHERLTLVADDMSLYAIINEMYTDAQKCNLMEIEVIRSFPFGNPLQKNSQLREMMSQGTLRLRENGIAKREMRVWYHPKPQCLGSTTYTHVTLEAVGLAFTLFMTGVVLSIFILLTEIALKIFLKYNFFSKKFSKTQVRPFLR